MLGLILTSCLTCGFLLYRIRPRLFNDPLVAQLSAQSIMSFTPCPGYEPKGTIDWSIPALISMRGVYYEHRTADGMLMLLEVTTPNFRGYQNVQDHIRNVLHEKNGISNALVVNPIVEQLTLQVQGRQRDFAISKARDPANKLDYRLLEGTVNGHAGQVLIGMRVVESAWDLDAVKNMLMSIQ